MNAAGPVALARWRPVRIIGVSMIITSADAFQVSVGKHLRDEPLFLTY